MLSAAKHQPAPPAGDRRRPAREHRRRPVAARAGGGSRFVSRRDPAARAVAKWGSPLHVIDVAALDATRDFHAPASSAARCEVLTPTRLIRLRSCSPGCTDSDWRRSDSAYELWLALRLGVAPSQIVYNGPVKSAESIRQAIDPTSVCSRPITKKRSACSHGLRKRPAGVRGSACA